MAYESDTRAGYLGARPSRELTRAFRDLGFHQDEVAATILPGHEDAADPPNPWADAARTNLQRIAEASRRIDSAVGRLPVPGTSDEVDVETMQMARQALEVAACALEFVETVRRRRLAEERRARKS